MRLIHRTKSSFVMLISLQPMSSKNMNEFEVSYASPHPLPDPRYNFFPEKMTLYGRAFGRCRGIRSNACVSSFDLLLAVLVQTTGLLP